MCLNSLAMIDAMNFHKKMKSSSYQYFLLINPNNIFVKRFISVKFFITIFREVT